MAKEIFPEQTETLSFDDIDTNELWLLGTPVPDHYVPEPDYICQMNERFVHTFLGEFS